MGGLPFTVYFDLGTITRNDIMNDPKMFVISYCQVYVSSWPKPKYNSGF